MPRETDPTPAPRSSAPQSARSASASVPVQIASAAPSSDALSRDAGAAPVPLDPTLAPEIHDEQRFVFTPPIDIYETPEGLVLEADLPGVTSETLELQVQDNKLTLFGRVVRQAPENAVVRHEEYGVGDYLRSFILSDEVDYDRISAKLQNGVLRVVLPKAAKAQPRRIEISTT